MILLMSFSLINFCAFYVKSKKKTSKVKAQNREFPSEAENRNRFRFISKKFLDRASEEKIDQFELGCRISKGRFEIIRKYK